MGYYLVSVIIPIHNRFSLVDEAVESVYNQTHRPIELILVDDHSDTPYTPKISSQPGFELKVLRHEENKGPGASRETGRQAADGDYIAYLDSDDLWHPEKLEKQVAMLKANPQAGMCYCQSVMFSSLPLTGKEPLRRFNIQEHSDFLPTIFYGRPWTTSACLWTRVATEKIGPWSDGWTWEDHEYECRAGAMSIKVSFLPEKLCYYLRNESDSQLSSMTYKLALIKRVPALLRMSNTINCMKEQTPSIKNVFIKLMKNTTSSLLKYHQREYALLLLREIYRSTSKNAFRRMVSGILLETLKHGKTNLSDKIHSILIPLIIF